MDKIYLILFDFILVTFFTNFEINKLFEDLFLKIIGIIYFLFINWCIRCW